MKIYAKQGTELEQIMKKLYDQMMSERKKAFEMIKEFSGVEPKGIGYYWAFGFTCQWSYNLVSYPEGSNPQRMRPYKINGTNYFEPNKRLKVAKDFMRKWIGLFKGIDGEVLCDHGIPISFDCNSRHVCWQPYFENGRYGILVPSLILDWMPEVKNKQYEIEV